ncbi:MAG: ADP-ribose pyrophosphatase [Gammaproteobacteria bacterium]|nr:ADP-ribose pyrophosphatase [Gammaproteobacteria bacterium]
MDPATSILQWARKVQAIAQNGLTFTRDPFDRERYEQLQELVTTILTSHLPITPDQLQALWVGDDGYATPKIDVRGGVFDQAKVLLVRERSDGKWTLPGGWVDIGDGPSFAVEREIREESGYLAKAVKLAALFDKNNPAHGHPPGIHHIYKLFFLCELTGGTPTTSNETDGVDFFPVSSLPPLSTGRATQSEIERLYQHHLNRGLPTDFD